MTLLTSLAFTVLTVLISVAGLLVFRQKMEADLLKEQHEVTDPYSQFVGMLFAVLLGFMVADAMNRYSDARDTVQREASALANVFRTAEGVSDDARKAIREKCIDYCNVIIFDEWPRLKEKKTSNKAWTVYRQLWKVCSDYEPVTNRQVNAQSALLNSMSEVGYSRRVRADALNNGMPIQLWLVLIIGGVSTIVFTYFFTTKSYKIQIAMVSIVSIVICLNIFLLASYDNPFSGDLMIGTSVFEVQLKLFEEELNPTTSKVIYGE